MSASPWRRPVRIAEVVTGAFRRWGLETRFRQSEIWRVWPSVVGPQIARRAQPHAMWRGRLTVHVTDPVWLHHLSMMRHRVVAALNEKLNTTPVREMILRVGEVDPPASDQPGSTAQNTQNQDPPPSPTQVLRIEALLAPLEDSPFREDLRRLLLRAYRPAGDDPSR